MVTKTIVAYEPHLMFWLLLSFPKLFSGFGKSEVSTQKNKRKFEKKTIPVSGDNIVPQKFEETKCFKIVLLDTMVSKNKQKKREKGFEANRYMYNLPKKKLQKKTKYIVFLIVFTCFLVLINV